MIKPTLQKPITIDSLQKYSIELEAYAYSLEVDCKELEDSQHEVECKLKELCSVAIGCSTFQKLRVEYIPENTIASNNSLTRALEKTKTLDKSK